MLYILSAGERGQKSAFFRPVTFSSRGGDVHRFSWCLSISNVSMPSVVCSSHVLLSSGVASCCPFWLWRHTHTLSFPCAFPSPLLVVLWFCRDWPLGIVSSARWFSLCLPVGIASPVRQPFPCWPLGIVSFWLTHTPGTCSYQGESFAVCCPWFGYSGYTLVVPLGRLRNNSLNHFGYSL